MKPVRTIISLPFYIVGLLAVAISFVFAIIMLFGSSTYTNALNQFYLVEYGTQNIGSAWINSSATTSNTDSQGVDNAITKTGLYPQYRIGIVGFCGLTDGDVSQCFRGPNLFYQDWVTVSKRAGKAVIDTPGNIQDMTSNIKTVGKATFVLQIIAVIFFGLSVLVGILALFSYHLAAFTSLLSFMGFAVAVVVAGINTGYYMRYQNRFNNDTSFGVTVHLSRVGFAFLWVEVVTSFFGALFWWATKCIRR
ncbi:hypothetical protein TRVA0_018S02344 [Trichomonascus vanleenenianus]|uniref:SUR7/PalI family protein n=1 Tax=Trichomonascus vanleenenianus TaxID=2268995 RepID=UPI003ECA7C8E